MKEKQTSSAWSLWVWVIFAFLLVIGAWTTLITLSQKYKPATVPTASHGESLDR